MNRYLKACSILLVCVMSALSVIAQTGKRAAAAKAVHIDVSKDKVGGESTRFLSVVGNWAVVEDEGKKIYAVDGREWLRGNPSRSLA